MNNDGINPFEDKLMKSSTFSKVAKKVGRQAKKKLLKK